ncbi:MAG: hypothetical protein J6R59_10345 [Paludibacteraceae bacterium]|nr:hypothetical protein [Paludibacteraceae bacterium]
MKIALLVLHIVAAIFFGVCAVINTNIVTESCYVFASAMWSICIGMDIANLILSN